MLIDRQIREALSVGDVTISPSDSIDARIQPASLDVRLGQTFLTLATHTVECIDPKVDTTGRWDTVHVEMGGYFLVHPGELVLAATYETIGLADHILARVEGKSSLGRLGVLVHATAGYIDPGWAPAPITLEISTVIGVPVKLYPGMPIAQLAFAEVEPVSAAYSGKYVGQSGPAASRYHRNWTGSAWI